MKISSERIVSNLKKMQISKHQKILLLSVITYTIIMTVLTYYKYYCFKSYAFDMGIFIQLFWNTIKGNPMFTQPRGSPLHPSNFFGVHFAPFLYTLIPFFDLFPHPITLFSLQSIFISTTAIVIYHISQHILKDEQKSLAFSVLYLIYPGTLWSNWYDFHLEAFIPLFTALTYYGYFKENKQITLISIILLITVLERNVFTAIAFTIYFTLRELYIKKRYNKSNKTTTTLLIGLIIVFSITYFFYSEQFITNLSVNRSTSNLSSIIGHIRYSQILIKISYITILMLPLAFLQLDAPLELIPAGPYLALVILTGYSPYFEITWQYPAIITVPFFVSAIMGAKKIPKNNLLIKITTLSLIFFLLISPGTPLMARLSEQWKISIPGENEHLKNKAINQIEQNASVLAQENIFPNVAMRKTVYSYWPYNIPPPDYIALDIKDYWLYTEPAELNLDDYLLLNGTKGYGIWAYVDGFIILKKGYQETPIIEKELEYRLDYENSRTLFVKYEKMFKSTNYFIPEWVKVEKDGLHIQDSYNISIWWGPYILLPPGQYEITIDLITESVPNEAILGIKASSEITGIYGRWDIYGANQTSYTTSLTFSTDEWVPDFEVVGRNYGNANFTVTNVVLSGSYE